jgi:hypothetical protein
MSTPDSRLDEPAKESTSVALQDHAVVTSDVNDLRHVDPSFPLTEL